LEFATGVSSDFKIPVLLDSEYALALKTKRKIVVIVLKLIFMVSPPIKIHPQFNALKKIEQPKKCPSCVSLILMAVVF